MRGPGRVEKRISGSSGWRATGLSRADAATLLGGPMNPRRDFVLRLFALLDAHGVPWCILRNYGEWLSNPDTDLDVLVAPEARGQFESLLARAAREAGFRLVQCVERACYSRTYRHPEAGFFRVDYYTELRWRVFPLVPAAQALAARRRPAPAEAPGLEGAFVPAPEWESALLWMEAVWRGYLSERYRARLVALRAACGDTAMLRETLCAAFGKAGRALAELQARLPEGRFDGALCAHVRRGLMLAALSSGWRFRALLRNTLADAARFARRLLRPAGVTLVYTRSAARERDFAELSRRLEFVFPAKRWAIQPLDVKTGGRLRRGWRTRLARWRTVFQGGVFVAVCSAREEIATAIVRRAARSGGLASRRFVVLENGAGHVVAAHAGTGFMAVSPAAGFADDGAWAAWLADFVASTLEHEAARDEAETFTAAAGKRRERGAFCVLVGLDGSGKTTLAREWIAQLTARGDGGGVRYFHWVPSLRAVEFPWPESGNRPRHRGLGRGPVALVLSAARLLKNCVRARLVWVLRLQPWLRGGGTVIVDRYFYNYFLDPASVKYSGPRRLLTRVTRWFPQPDLVVVLRAPMEVLLARKQELTEAELREQAARLDALDFGRARVLRLESTRPPSELAEAVVRFMTGGATLEGPPAKRE
jgi:thymidylate kinase